MNSTATPRMLIAELTDIMDQELKKLRFSLEENKEGRCMTGIQLSVLKGIGDILLKMRREERAAAPTDDEIALMSDEEIQKALDKAVADKNARAAAKKENNK